MWSDDLHFDGQRRVYVPFEKGMDSNTVAIIDARDNCNLVTCWLGPEDDAPSLEIDFPDKAAAKSQLREAFRV